MEAPPAPARTALDADLLDGARASGDGQPQETTFKCPDCPKTFATERGLRMHRARSHKPAAKSKPKGTRRPQRPKPKAFDQRALITALFPGGVPATTNFERLYVWIEEAKTIRETAEKLSLGTLPLAGSRKR